MEDDTSTTTEEKIMDANVPSEICTHTECPYCDYDEFLEGDVIGDIVNCGNCGKKYRA